MDLPLPASPIMPLLSGQAMLNQARARGQTATPGSPSTSPAPLSPTAPASQSAAAQAMQKVGQEFESMFVSEMLKPMFEGLKTDELGGGGDGEEAFRPLLIDQYSQALTKSGGIGIAQAVVRELMQMQAGHAPTAVAPAAPLPIETQLPIATQPIPTLPTHTQESTHGAHG